MLAWLCLLCATGHAQFVAPERAAMSSLEKKKWEKSKAQLAKSLRKDTLNPTASYIYALYFFSKDNPAFHVDSAYYYTLRSLSEYGRSDAKSRERMKRFPLDTVILSGLSRQIDSAAFEQTTRINTEDAYIKFLSVYTSSVHQMKAIELRNEVAWLAAIKEDTYQAFESYVAKYPSSARAAEAQKKYDQRLFETKTADKQLKSFETFLEQFPSSPYKREVEQQVFELMTASGTTGSFEKYLNKYPKSSFASRGQNLLYHILLESNQETESPVVWNDSLRVVHSLEKKYIIPVFKDSKFGFIDQDGIEVIHPFLETLDDKYRCGNIREDVLVVNDKVFAKNGKIILQDSIHSVEDIGYGFLLVELPSCMSMIHKSGRVIIKCVDDVKLLNGRLIAVKRDNQWSLYSLSGRNLSKQTWDDIETIGDVFVFQKDKKYSLAAGEDFFTSTTTSVKEEYDEVKSWTDNRIWFRKGDTQGILNESLTVFIRPEQHVIRPGRNTSIADSKSGSKLFDNQGRATVTFSSIVQNENWTAVKNESWRLFDPVHSKYLSASYDTIYFTGPFAIAGDDDTTRVFFSTNKTLDLPVDVTIEFIPGKDATSYLVTTEKEKRVVYSHEGKLLFTGAFDKIQSAGGDIFIVQKKDKSKKDKRGLLSKNGKMLLPIEFDAIGTAVDGTVSLLKDKKFGLFDVKSLRQIKPEYSKNINKYSNKYLVVYREGFYGFVGWDNKPVGVPGFEEIRYWNDSVSWVRKNFQWMLYNIRSQQVEEDQIKDYVLVAEYPDEKIAIIHQEGHYGVISSKKDEIIPPTLNRIVNVGSTEHPMYFTAKHVEEASIYVVIYYNQKGELLRRQVYEEEDYAKIFCTRK
jgi:hypothetical protein